MSQTEKSKTTQTTGYTPSQTAMGEQLTKTYSPYIGQGTLGGLSGLEESALGMLRSADIWGPMTTAGTGLLTGTMGAQPLTQERAGQAFEQSVAQPTWYNWQDKIKPAVQEAYSGPGYWGSARSNAQAESAGDVGRWLGSERANWMWNAEQANRAIEEAKAGRALSAMGAVPSGMLGWTGGLLGQGAQVREILNQVTDPQVLQVLQMILGTQLAPRVTRGTGTPSEFQQGMNWSNAGAKLAMMIGGLGGGGAGSSALGSMNNPYSGTSQYSLGGYGGGFG